MRSYLGDADFAGTAQSTSPVYRSIASGFSIKIIPNSAQFGSSNTDRTLSTQKLSRVKCTAGYSRKFASIGILMFLRNLYQRVHWSFNNVYLVYLCYIVFVFLKPSQVCVSDLTFYRQPSHPHTPQKVLKGQFTQYTVK